MEISAKAEGPRAPFRSGRAWLWGLALVAAVVLVYSPVWWAGYVWDDVEIITTNPVVVGPLGLKEIWTTDAADICPLTISTFWLEHALWGLPPLPFHLVNVFLHAACAIVLWRLLRNLQVPGAWLGAALWALHPVQVESVAWISELKNTESGLFFLLAILFFAKGLGTKERPGRIGRGWSYGLTLLFSILAMVSKSSTLILPVVLCLCAWWVEGRWHWRNLLKVLTIILLSIPAGIFSMATQMAHAELTLQGSQSWPQRLAIMGDVVWFYLGKLIWPNPLIVVYPRWQIDAGQWFACLPLLAVVVLLFVLWLKRASWGRPWFFAFAYFLVALFPVMGWGNLSYFRYTFVADHFQYLAGMGPLALAGAGFVRLADFIMPGKPQARWVLGAGVLLILGFLSWRQAWVYESEKTLWTDVVTKNPDCWVGYDNLGIVYANEGHSEQAMADYEKALELNPDFAEAHINMGAALLRTGQPDGAIVELQKALEMDSNFSDGHNDLGVALAEKGRLEDAVAQFQQALELKPDYVEAQQNLAKAQGLIQSQAGQK